MHSIFDELKVIKKEPRSCNFCKKKSHQISFPSLIICMQNLFLRQQFVRTKMERKYFYRLKSTIRIHSIEINFIYLGNKNL